MKKRNESNSNSSARNRSHGKSSKRRTPDRVNSRRLMMEGLESRQLMAVLTGVPTQSAPADLPVYDTARNVGTVSAFNVNETESSDLTSPNNSRFTAQILPFGTGANQQDTIDLSGTLPINSSQTNGSGFSADIDVYGFDLRAGDIIDIATSGAAGGFALQGPYDAQGQSITTGPNVSVSFASSVLVGGVASPLQTIGNASGSVVIPQDGRYFITIGATTQTNTYTVGLRAYRPVTESLAYGDAQILYLDWEGGFVDSNVFADAVGDDGLPLFGFITVPSIDESAEALGLERGDTASIERITNEVYEDVIRIYEDLGDSGSNGDFEDTGVAGDYALRILNSRDLSHRQWYEMNSNDPRITRMIIGGTGLDIGVPGVFGISDYVDVGNFDLTQLGLFALDGFQGSTLGSTISPAVSEIDATIQFLSSVIAHEAAHTFGMIHTNNTNTIESLSDEGGGNSVAQGLGVGTDGIFGTIDDVDPIFRDDFYQDPTITSGFYRVTSTLSQVLSSGTVGQGGTSGVVFNDTNQNGVRNIGELGISGVTVFADVDGNGILNSGDFQTTTGADGSYSLGLPTGSFTLRAITPDGFIATTADTVSSNGGASFGFRSATSTGSSSLGTVYSDINGNGIADTGEGIAGVYVYLDMDGDRRPDLFEPNTRTGSDGTYNLLFPSEGTYSIVAIAPDKFSFDDPSNGVRQVTFSSSGVSGSGDFILESQLDYGDAPDSYGTTDSANGASHSIVSGLSIGGAPDAESDGQPTTGATGDNSNGVNDEDGVELISPLGLGSPGVFSVTVTNTTGSPAYLQAFIDLNSDGDFSDAGEQFVTDQLIPTGTVGLTATGSASIPSTATAGDTFARFRLSLSPGLGATGFVDSGEVEDYAVSIDERADIVNADPTPGDAASEALFTVSRNTLSNSLNVLANDFDPDNNITIGSLDRTGTQGIVERSSDGRSVDYTPPNGFSGVDRFQYSVLDSLGNPVRDQSGNIQFATVTVTVTFQSAVPIAVDDTYEVPEQSSNRPLNVLDNDVPSSSGGLTITSVTAGSGNGTVRITGGGQSIRYTPLPSFTGTEQFTYSVQDSAGQVSSAQVTVNILSQENTDDNVVGFNVGVFSPDANTPDLVLDEVRVGDEFLLRVSVDDLDPDDQRFASEEGVASAFLDLLYTNELVTFRNSTNTSSPFPFDISFGDLFTGSENFLQRANANTPGLFDEVGGVQPLTNQMNHDGSVTLFEIRMVANAPGVAQFIADPADETPSETVVLAADTALTPSQLELGRTELVILPSLANPNFTSATEDSFPDGRDSDGVLISSTAASPNRLDILANDNLGPSGTIREFGEVTSPTYGTLTKENNGTPNNPNDDFFSYRADANANGLERFTYFILTEDGASSEAEVTFPVGLNSSTAEVAMDFSLVSAVFDSSTGGYEAGAALPSGTTFTVGQTFGVQISVDDLRSFDQTFVFAGFLDVLYSQDTIRPADAVAGTQFDFDVEFGSSFDAAAGVGSAAKAGIIDEFGTVSTATNISQGTDPATLATLFFTTIASGEIRIAGSPADESPFQDTLLFSRDQPVETDKIRYDVLTSAVASTGEGESLQNPSLAQDVNNDGAVSPIDALLIINQMSRSSGIAEGESAGPLTSIYYTDVNGDNETSAIDALQVINYLARQASGGEGELIVAPPASSSGVQVSGDDASVSDSVFADLGDDGKLLSSDSAGDSNATQAVVASQTTNQAGEEDDDILRLLADDVQGLWS